MHVPFDCLALLLATVMVLNDQDNATGHQPYLLATFFLHVCTASTASVYPAIAVGISHVSTVGTAATLHEQLHSITTITTSTCSVQSSPHCVWAMQPLCSCAHVLNMYVTHGTQLCIGLSAALQA